MAVFCKLRDPEHYRPCDWDLADDEAGRKYWIAHFASHIETILQRVLERYGPQEAEKFERFRCEYIAGLNERMEHPERFAPLTILALDEYREAMLRKFGWRDAFEHVKRAENDAALSLLPQVLQEIDHLDGPDRIEALLRGVFAGNIFDLGSAATVQRYQQEGIDFFRTRQDLPERAWLVDDLDEVIQRFSDGASPYRKVMFFLDNSGADLILGCLPLARQLALWGTRVVLAANDHPSLNDITVRELRAVLHRAAGLDEAISHLLKNGNISVVGTGNGAPLIDLSKVSDECNAAAADCDLIILEGMGRAVESNFNATFTCDCLKLALIKDEAVARHIGGRLFDIVCKFEPA